MASIFKAGGTGNYKIAYSDANGKRRVRSAGTTDFRAAERIANKIEADLALRRDGVIDAKLDRFANEAKRPIGEHVCEFLESARGRVTPQQAAQLKARISRVLQLANLSTLGDFTLSAVESALGDLLRNGYVRQFTNGNTRREALSIRTVAYHAKAMRQFARWLARDGRVSADPLISLKTSTTDADNVYNRRELSTDELSRIVNAAEHGPTIFGMTGIDRAMVYRVASGTGFRANELRNLTAESFDLDGDAPTITVNATFSKRRRTDIQPIRVDLAESIRPWLATKPAGEPVFNLPDKTAKMLHKDMAVARGLWLSEATTEADRQERGKSDFLKPVDGNGSVADFHSLRHGFISSIVNSGASVKVAQELARHSTPILTIGRYAHARLNDLTGALDKLSTPGLKPLPEQQRMRATGTFDARSHSTDLPPIAQALARMAHFTAKSSDALRNRPSCQSMAPNENVAIIAGKCGILRCDANACETEGVGARTQDLRLKRPLLDSTTSAESTSYDAPKLSASAIDSARLQTCLSSGSETTAPNPVDVAPTDPRLAELMDAWQLLPDGVRDALVAMVRATAPKR